MTKYTELNKKSISQRYPITLSTKPSLAGQKSRVQISAHAHEYRGKTIFSRAPGTRKILAGLWQGISGVTAMNLKRQQNGHCPCALVRVSTGVSLMLLPPVHLDISLLRMLVSLTLITLEGESRMTRGCWFYTRKSTR